MNEIAGHFDRLLADACTPRTVRAIEGAIEGGGEARELWNTIDAAGFLDALVPHGAGGQGLALCDTADLVVAMGRRALPLPAAHTLFARAALAQAEGPRVRERIAIAPAATEHDGRIVCLRVPFGLVADWIVAPFPRQWQLLPAGEAARTGSGIHGDLHADLAWECPPAGTFTSAVALPWVEAGAIAAAASMAGALQGVLETTVQFANDRVQFGKPIGRYQAIQQQLALLAGDVAASRVAAIVAANDAPSSTRPASAQAVFSAAVAKARVGESATRGTSIAHQVHGAIGFTHEHQLHFATRRLWAWREEFGSDAWWAERLGQAAIQSAAAGFWPALTARQFPGKSLAG